MSKLLKRLLIFVLCVAMILADNSVHGLAAEINGVVENVNEDDNVISYGIDEDYESTDFVEDKLTADSKFGDKAIEYNTCVIDVEADESEDSVGVEDNEIEAVNSNEGEVFVEVEIEEEALVAEQVFVAKPINGVSYSLKYTLDNNLNATIIGWIGEIGGDLIIPSSINGYSVTTIGEFAFNGCSEFTGLNIADSVTTIEMFAFGGCSGLIGPLVIPDSVITIGNFAFSGCIGFSGSLKIPDSVTLIGDDAFKDCYRFTGPLVIPDSVRTIGDDAFIGCKGFTGSLTLSDSVTEIGNYAFCGCRGLTGSLIIPNSVVSIGESAFFDCRGFNGSLIIPDSVTTIGEAAFGGCSALSIVKNQSDCEVYLPENVKWFNVETDELITHIKKGTAYCERTNTDLSYLFLYELKDGNACLTGVAGEVKGELIIPSEIDGYLVTTIGSFAFYDCKGFTGSLIIPDSVTTIGESAFGGCTGFSGTLTIPDSVTIIGDAAFGGCTGFTGLLTIPDSVTTLGRGAFYRCSGFEGPLVIPNSITAIETITFYGCSGLTGSLVIPDSVTTIGGRAFYGCSGFNGLLVVPDTVKIIGDAAFDGCNGLIVAEEGIFALPIYNQAYTGVAIKPNIKVYDGNKLLINNIDYTISYSNNVNAYTLSEEDEGFDYKYAPAITITGKGNYASNKEKIYFKINPVDISVDTETEEIVVKSTGKDQKPKPIIKWNNKALPAAGYSYQYFKASEAGTPEGEAIASVNKEGKYIIVITGQGNFKGTRELSLTVLGEQKPVSKLAINSIKAQTYTGDYIEPKITVNDGKVMLKEGTDYTLSYQNNFAVGTASVIVKGLGNYVGTKKVTFKITGTPISKTTVEGIIPFVTYTGNDITFDDIKLYIKATKTTDQINLKEGVDYTVSYQKNQSAGTAIVVITGINGYTGTLKKTFKIIAFKESNAPARFTTFLSAESIEYCKGGAKPGVTVKFTNADGTERTLAEKTDYTVAYVNNGAVNDCSNPAKLPTAKITLKGSYSGTILKTYAITPKNISSVKVEVADKTYANKKGAYKSAVKLYDTDGKALASKKDYDATITYTLEDGTPLDSTSIVDANQNIVVTVSAKEGGNYTGTVTEKYRITTASIGTPKVTIKTQTYTGKPIELTANDITIKPGIFTPELEMGVDYKIVPNSYVNNVKKGTASVVIRGIGNYGGTRKVNFTIKQKVFKWWWR